MFYTANISSIAKSEFKNRVQNIETSIDISDGLKLKTVVITDRLLSEDEYKMLNILANNYKSTFEEDHTKGYGNLNTSY